MLNIFKSNLKAEIDLAKKVSHPYLMRIIDHEETSEGIAVIMELMDKDIQMLMQGRNDLQLHPKIVQKIIYNSISALYFLQENYSFSHRNMKPQNILVKGDTVKLSDFNFAKNAPKKCMLASG